VAVFAKQPFFHFKWDTLKSQDVVRSRSLQIVGMHVSVDSLASTDAFHFLSVYPFVIEHGPIACRSAPCFVQNEHMLRKRSMSWRSSRSSCRSLFSPVSRLLDVRARRIPARDVSVVIDDRLVLNKKPSCIDHPL